MCIFPKRRQLSPYIILVQLLKLDEAFGRPQWQKFEAAWDEIMKLSLPQIRPEASAGGPNADPGLPADPARAVAWPGARLSLDWKVPPRYYFKPAFIAGR